ncbi:DNA repair protein complementing XP-C cells-like [Anopheles maculipalpis]|uniref:DNA repair protein complementing XP-C cells-like n=1 Tax=Anopheles maculipalpis TaxID=1496333 RepID=UPI002159691C|nr:DNA repair protein complementing XP-C cells-like [Anopheles maculipalpis]
MKAVSRAKLRNLLLKKNTSHMLKPEDISKSSEEVISSLLPQASTLDAYSQPFTAEDVQMHEQEVPSDSDSDASSVGDHLVDPSTINLDETFFSQPLQNLPATATIPYSGVALFGDASGRSESEDEKEPAFEEDDRMYQIFTQISDYDRMIKEVKDCNESLERRRKAMESLQKLQAYEESYDVPLMLTQMEDIQEVPLCAGGDPDWEHVEQKHIAQAERDNNIEIIVSGNKQRTTRTLTAAEKLKRLEQENTKKLFLATHKTHLLLLIAYGIRINQAVNQRMIQCASELYGLVESSDISMCEAVSLDFIQSVTEYYQTVMKLCHGAGPRVIKRRNDFERELASREVTSRQMLNIILLALFRFLSVRARLVMNLDVVPKHPPVVKSMPKEKRQLDVRKDASDGTSRYGNVPLTTTEILKRKPEIQKMFQLSQLDGADDELILNKKSRVEIEPTKSEPSKLNLAVIAPKSRKEAANRLEDHFREGEQKALRLISSKYFRHKPATKQMNNVRGNTINTSQKPNFAKLLKKTLDSSVKDGSKSEENSLLLSSSKYFRKKPSAVQTASSSDHKKSISNVPNLAKLRRQSSSTVGESVKKTDKQTYRIPELDTWIECYLGKERRWTVVEAGLGSADCLELVMDRILAPPSYAFAWEADGTIVDVSPRYRWRNEQLALKNRVDTKWLRKALSKYRPRELDEAHLQEQLEFRQLKLRAPRPITIAQCKNHPSYCLRRHLQKFQAIYPPDAPPLGFVQGEPLFARECVHTLHSREVWLRHAKVIRLYEQPYKIVRTKLKRQPADLELFGYWQTEEYIPPEPVNGIVPRNAYGNIEIFKECMLPKGTVHLKHYGLSYICRKLGIDYAVAVVGFGVHAGGNHPVFDGIVICEEHRDRLLEAWQRHQDEVAQKKIEKRQTAVLKNWEKLVKGLLVRRKLKHKYNFDGM